MSLMFVSTQILSPLVVLVCVFLLVKYVPVAAKYESSGKWWLIFGICVSFFGMLLCEMLRSRQEIDTPGLWFVAIVSQTFTIVAAICHLVAVTVYIGKDVTSREVWTALSVAGLIVFSCRVLLN